MMEATFTADLSNVSNIDSRRYSTFYLLVPGVFWGMGIPKFNKFLILDIDLVFDIF